MSLQSLIVAFFLGVATLPCEKTELEFNHKQTVVLPPSENCLIKIEEEIGAEGFGKVSYQMKENETLIISYEKRDINLIKEYFDKRIDLQSLIFDEDHDPSALTRMKELRLEYRKKECPYSIWKLRYAKNSNDVVYEYKVPPGGAYKETYVLNRLIKAKEGYFRISIECPKEHEKEVLFYLSEIAIS